MKVKSLILFILVILLGSCSVPTQNTLVDGDIGLNDNTSDTNDGNDVGSENNYFQLSSTTTQGTLSFNIGYTDSFLLRGNNIHSYLLNNSNQSQTICMIAHFSSLAPQKAVIMAARKRSTFNYALGITEYYLQVEPNNTTTANTDCSDLGITTTIQSLYGAIGTEKDTQSLCSNCTSPILSQEIKLLIGTGSVITEVSTPNMRLNLLPSNSNGDGGDSGTQNSCTEDTTCNSSGFDCCLQGQCVNHAAVREGVDTTDPNYLTAIAQVTSDPTQVINYPNFFYICPNMVSGDDGGDDTTDPNQQVNEELLRLQELYSCMNPVEDEYAICTKIYANAQQTITDNSGSFNFESSRADITFRNLNASITNNNIKEISYGEVAFFKDGELNLDPSYGTLNTHNDDLTTAQSVTLTSLPTGNIHNNLKLKYRVDASCRKLNTQLAQCTKTYKQGQVTTPAKTTDHVNTQSFLIPSYANTAYNLIVKVGGVSIPPSTNTWSLSGFAVIFNAAQNPIYLNQEVEISYFVTSNIDFLTEAMEEAQTEVNTLCSCTGDIDCYLEPVHENPSDTSTPIVNYSCQAESNDNTDVPLQTTLYISSKSVAHKFYDSSGVYYKYDELGTHEQECARGTGNEAGCDSFKYTDGNLNKPNNVSQYIGFNEIYGTFNDGDSPAVPATEIDVIKGRTYDIFTDEGLFSTCENCGTDYYSSLAKIFPNSFVHKGGGYLPNMVESRRADNQSEFNADDMKFGRACFVPATMIPWTHTPNADVTTQRRQRLTAQHFMFANGYNKDWYGFDYGSLIGSFDGVKWFSIGNQRNILAKSNKLYLAINAYYGDQTLENSFRVTVNEVVPILNSGSDVTHDTLSDGAQCQLAHYCDTDNDCIANLGYDYTCENVGALRTPWPRFDDNGNEISGQDIVGLLSLVDGANGQAKRCVYRGRGSLCSQSPSTISVGNSYTESTKKSLHTCSNNTFCSSLSINNFNNRISRYARSLTSQNAQTFVTDKTDLFGMDARILGRPYEFFGNEAANTIALSQLNTNNVDGMCVPGKNPTAATTIDQLNSFDPIINKADINFELGRTHEGLGQNENYFAACPATGEDNNFTYKTSANDENLNSAIHKKYAISQNMSTNSFNLSSLVNSNMFNDTGTQKTTVGYDQNACLRSPGSSCFTDMDCSVNSWVSNKFKAISDFSGEISQAEIDFWSEDLICGTSQARYPAGSIYPNPSYASNEKKCCREIDKTFTFYTQRQSGSDFTVEDASGDPAIPGVNLNLNDSSRYSRLHTIYDILDTSAYTYPLLITPNENSTVTAILTEELTIPKYQNQYKTLHEHNQRMCCTGHWVREFNSGGHQFDGSTGQNFASQSTITNIFRPLNWLPNTDPANNEFFYCNLTNADTSECELRNITEGSAYEEKWLNYFSKFELTGIPQIYIESHDDGDADPQTGYSTPVNSAQDAFAGTYPIGATDVLTDGIVNPSEHNIPDIETAAGKKYYSAASAGSSTSKYKSSYIKKVFSDKDFACCMPTGIQVEDTVTNSQCCTGQVTDQNGPRRCCLNDYADLSVYTNRYVSSEGAVFNGLEISDSDVDKETGYIRKELVKQMGATMCCSGRAEYGVAISELSIPLVGDTVNANLKKRRFIDNDGMDNAQGVNGVYTYFSYGRKWNNHVYCVPADSPF